MNFSNSRLSKLIFYIPNGIFEETTGKNTERERREE
jgi:hypothetical protein